MRTLSKAAQDMFGTMRSSTEEERLLFESWLESASTEIGDIMAGDTKNPFVNEWLDMDTPVEPFPQPSVEQTLGEIKAAAESLTEKIKTLPKTFARILAERKLSQCMEMVEMSARESMPES